MSAFDHLWRPLSTGVAVLGIAAAGFVGCAGGGGNGSSDDEDPPDVNGGPGIAEEVPAVTMSPAFLNIADVLDQETISVVLDTEPDGDVVIVLFAEQGKAEVQSAPDSSELTFTPDDWDVPQDVTVIAGANALGGGDGTFVVSAYADPEQTADTTGYASEDGLVVNGVEVTVAQNTEVLFVDPSATGTGDGSSWDNAYTDLQTAVDVAHMAFDATGQVQVVWVAAGTYRPSSPGAPVVTLPPGVGLEGGFIGLEQFSQQRPGPWFRTELNGDVLGDDVAGDLATNRSDNAKHVVVGADSVQLDGFVIRGGHATGATATDQTGGGLLIEDEQGTFLINVSFEENWAEIAGGGIGAIDGAIVQIQIFESNFAGNGSGDYGGGLAVHLGEVILQQVTFEGNESMYGGGLSVPGSPPLGGASSVDLVVEEVSMTGNTASVAGGGLFFNSDGNAEFVSLTMRGNTAETGGGALLLCDSAVEVFIYLARIEDNTAPGGNGGGLYLACDAFLEQVLFLDNTAASLGGGLYLASPSAPELNHLTFSGNTAGIDGGGLYDDASDPVLNHVTFFDNDATGAGGGANAVGSLTYGVFWGNTAGTQDPDVGSGSVDETCSEDDLTGLGTGNITLGGDPTELAASGDPFLDSASGCVDVGDESLSTVPWDGLVIGLDGTLDVDGAGSSDIDLGHHYETFWVWIETLDVDATDLSWVTHGATACEVSVGGGPVTVALPDADLASGSLAHGQSSGTELRLTCTAVGVPPAMATVTVP